jgi:hypothetical protein
VVAVGVVCHPLAAAADLVQAAGRVGLDLAVQVSVAPAAPTVGPAVRVGPVVLVTVGPAALVTVAPVTVGPAAPVTVAPVVLVTSVGPVGLAVLVTSVDQVAPVVLVTSVGPVGRVALETSVGPVVLVTSVVRTVPTTSDRGLRTRSAGGEVPRGVMELRRGVGALRHEPDGAARFRLPAASGTKGRSTTGATTRPPSGIRAKTAGASTSSEYGSRCKRTAR